MPAEFRSAEGRRLLTELRKRPTEHPGLADALIAAAQAVDHAPGVAVLELLDLLPGALDELGHLPAVAHHLVLLFQERAYLALRPLAGRRPAPGKAVGLRSRAGWVRPGQVPDWINAVQHPRGFPVAVLANRWRCDVAAIVGRRNGGYFAQLAAVAKDRTRAGDRLALLELLDMFPMYLHHLGTFRWMLDDLRRRFEAREYRTFLDLSARVGKVGSDLDLIRFRTLMDALVEPMVVRPATAMELGISGGWSRTATRYAEVVDAFAKIDRSEPPPLDPQQLDRHRRLQLAARKRIQKSIERGASRYQEMFGENPLKEILAMKPPDRPTAAASPLAAPPAAQALDFEPAGLQPQAEKRRE